MERLAALIERLSPGRRVLAAIDGPDAAGKTTLVLRLARHLVRPAVRASIDGWLHPREARLRRGDESPEGYYLEPLDLDSFVRECLGPFTAGAARIRTARFDHRTEGEVESSPAPDAVLLVDGAFLLRPELRARWDLSVYLHIPESATLARAVQRDVPMSGTVENVRRRYERRSLRGQACYRQAAAPIDHADVVLDNSHPSDPVVLNWRPAAEAARSRGSSSSHQQRRSTARSSPTW